MKRAPLGPVLLVMLLAGCNRALPEREAELAALKREEAHLGAQLNLLTRNLNTLKGNAQGEENRSKANSAALRALQVAMVETWKGEAATLEAKKKAVQLPKSLADALDLAQSVAGGEALEKRFVRALAANDGKELAGVLQYWEANWLEGNSAPEEEEDPKVCPTNRTLSCTAIDDDSLWCPDPDQGASWALLLDNGALTVGRLAGGQGHEIDGRLAPRVWLTRVGDTEKGALFLHTLRNGSFVTQWQARFVRDDGRLERLQANFDEDPFSEGLFWTKDDLLFADPTSRDEVSLMRDLQACEALALLEGVPAPVRERCRVMKTTPVPVDAGVP